MRNLLRSASGVARDIARIAAAPPAGEQVEEVLSLLYRVIPYDAAWLGLIDDTHQRYTGLVNVGYDDRTRHYFDTRELREQVDRCALNTSPAPQCIRDTSFPFDELPVWSEYYRPAGLFGGMAVGLFTRDRRHLGMLLISTDDWGNPTDEARDLIGALAPRIAAVVDPTRTVTELARIVRDALGGVVLTGGGRTLPLCGLPGHELLSEGSALLGAAARQHAQGGGCVSFLWPASRIDDDERDSLDDDERDSLVQVVVLGCPPYPSRLVAVVVRPPPAARPRLTRYELTVLSMLLDGWPEQRIAGAMGLSVYAVVETTERIVYRLGTRDRHAALLRAARQGWFIPHGFGGTPA
ncbi:response regulator transcription factor [Plantactinospora sp. S1510]|uniref:Response regulator transcription factor n=1 Tax=Plantactinospora alkalitolerans TaxID=2789879 RepID=A0ABS0H7Y0_9ACTN|nr:helix-turn-helix transcriptional regulator [Plantactinospora alkalitolerans]MBF9134582.1 response regulator transcription factor [Plantactinospora alkalitolerans]